MGFTKLFSREAGKDDTLVNPLTLIKDPDFIQTSRHDGRKTVDLDKLFKDPKADKQMEQLRKEVIEPRLPSEQGKQQDQPEDQT